jgi:hypothetical protein
MMADDFGDNGAGNARGDRRLQGEISQASKPSDSATKKKPTDKGFGENLVDSINDGNTAQTAMRQSITKSITSLFV